jgi:uncharacterized zinc-type alcohol dehydrogenase-like protein
LAELMLAARPQPARGTRPRTRQAWTSHFPLCSFEAKIPDVHAVLKVPETLEPAAAAPLLCAGITTWSPLRLWNVKKGDRVGVVGLGGLGHVAVKLAAAMGAEVTLFSTSPSKKADAARLGASDFTLTTEPGSFAALENRFNLLIDTVSAPHDLNAYLRLLKPFGTMTLLGAITGPPSPVSSLVLLTNNRRLAGTSIGGIAETQELLDFCGQHRIAADVEVIAARQINEAYERIPKSDVRYRFVIDAKTL